MYTIHDLTYCLYSPITVVAAPAAAPATSHLLIVGSSNFDSMNRPTMIQPCILKAFSGIMPNVREITPTQGIKMEYDMKDGEDS